MALRNQPYFPLYVQDYLTDEKLNSCSAASQGVYIKIMCILHKQETYGELLFKQKDKQTDKQILNFALKFAKLLPFDTETIFNALVELVDEGVLTIDGDKIYQKRMVKDGYISSERSKSGKKGGGNPNLFKQNPKQTFKQKDKQNPENEIEYENEDEDEKEKGVQGEKQFPHELYGNHSIIYAEANSKELEKELENNYSQHESLVTTAFNTYGIKIEVEDVKKMIPAFMVNLTDTSSYPIADKAAKAFFGNWFKSKLKQHATGTNKNGNRTNNRVGNDYRDKLARDLQAGINQAASA